MSRGEAEKHHTSNQSISIIARSPSHSQIERRLEAIAEAPGPGIDCSGGLIREWRPRKITNLEFGRNIAHQLFEKPRGTSGKRKAAPERIGVEPKCHTSSRDGR